MNNSPTRPLRLIVTTRCSARCAHCHHEGLHATVADLDATRFRQEVGTGFFRHFSQVSITGGEPLLHPHIRTIVSHVVSSTAGPVAINTNGLAQPGRLAELLHMGVTAIHVSVHSSYSEVNARIFGVPYDRAKVLRNAEAVIASGVGLYINRVILPGINSEPAEVIDFAEHWVGKGGVRVQLFPNLYEDATANEQVFAGILAEAHHRGYQCQRLDRQHVFDHASRGSFTWTSPCTPEAENPPDYATAAVFMTPRMSLKRMLSPREWPWQASLNRALPASLMATPLAVPCT